MSVIRGYKYRIYPTNYQKYLLAKTFGCCRKIYNWAIDYVDLAYKNSNFVKFTELSKQLTQKKREWVYLSEIDSIALQQELKHLDVARSRFFSKIGGKPKYHNRHQKQSYTTVRTPKKTNVDIDFESKRIKLPKIGLLKFRNLSRKFNKTKIKSVTVTKSTTEKYYVSFLIECEEISLSETRLMSGIDLGLKRFATITNSNGQTIIKENPKFIQKWFPKLKEEQKKLSKLKFKSNNYQKQRLKVAKIHEKIVNCRNDFLHKLSYNLCNENQVIAVEDLDVKGMMQNNRDLARMIADAGWSRFIELLEYKQQERGHKLVKVDRYYPSSQLCNSCKQRTNLTKNLKVRIWKCPCCGEMLDRDENASKNILEEGQRLINL